MRPLLSVILALGASAIGFPLVWFAGGAMYESFVRNFGPSPALVVPAVLFIFGCLLLLAAGASIWLSGLGAVVAGGIHLLAGIVFMAWPYDPLEGVRSPIVSLTMTVTGISRELGTGMSIFLAAGAGLLVGAVLLAAGLVTLRPRPATASSGLRAIAIVAGSVLLLVGIAFGSISGSGFYREFFVYLQPQLVTGLLVLLFVVLAGLGAASARWSAVPLLLAGALTTIVGIVMIVAPQPFFGMQALRDLIVVASVGVLVTVGVVITGAGIGVALHRLRRPSDATAPSPFDSPLPPPTGEPRQAV